MSESTQGRQAAKITRHLLPGGLAEIVQVEFVPVSGGDESMTHGVGCGALQAAGRRILKWAMTLGFLVASFPSRKL